MTVVTCSRQEILPLANIHPTDPINMALQCQLTNTTSGVPHSYTMIMGTSDNPLKVIREERSGMNASLSYEGSSVNVQHCGPEGQ